MVCLLGRRRQEDVNVYVQQCLSVAERGSERYGMCVCVQRATRVGESR